MFEFRLQHPKPNVQLRGRVGALVFVAQTHEAEGQPQGISGRLHESEPLQIEPERLEPRAQLVRAT